MLFALSICGNRCSRTARIKTRNLMRKTVVMQAAMWYDIYKVLSLVEESVLPFAAVRVGGEVCQFHITDSGSC